MSLIVDALKAAEQKRGARAVDEPEDRARRFLGSAGGRPVPPAQARVVWARRPPRSLPRQLGIATSAFAASLLLVAAMAWLAPQAASRAADSLLTGEQALRQMGVSSAAFPWYSPGIVAAEGPALEEAPPSRPIQVARGRERPEETAPPRQAASEPAATGATEPAGPGQLISVPAPAAEETETPAAPPAPVGEPVSSRRLRVDLAPASPAAEDLARSALDAQRRRDFASAVRLYTEALARGPERPELLNNLGLSHQALDDLPRARDAFRRALAIQPDYAGAWSNLGVVLGALREETEARTALAEAMRLDPANPGVRVNLALAYLRQGLPGEARDLLTGVLAIDSTHAEAHYALGQLLDGSGERAAAARHYRAFLRHGMSRFPQVEPLVRQRIEKLEGKNER